MYGEKPKIILFREKSDPKCIECEDEEKFRKELALHVQMVPDDDLHYNKAEIFLPSDILMAGLVIVDSPGIGENEKMKEMVLNYTTSACAFIFMVNLLAAGGLQQRMDAFLREFYQKAMKDQKWSETTENCLFVCNKWDMVPNEEMEQVKQDTVEKIQKMDDFKRCKVFMMSTMEADFLQNQREERLSPKFLVILQEIQRLIPVGRKNLLRKEHTHLEDFVSECLLCILTHLSDVGKSKLEKETRHAYIGDKLNSVAKGIEKRFKKQKEDLQSKLEKIANNLQTHMKQKDTMDAVCKFTYNELPKERKWEDAAAEVRQQVYLKIMHEITKWEENNRLFEKIATDVTKELADEFPKFEEEIKTVQCNMTEQTKRLIKDAGDEEVEFVPGFLQGFYQKIGFRAKIAMSIGLSPIFIVGTLLRAPIYGFLSIKKKIETRMFSKRFAETGSKNEQKDICEKYARKVIDHICSSVDFKAVINEDVQPMFQYIDNHQNNLQKRIEADQALLKKLQNDIRTDDEIKKTFEPLKERFEKLQNTIQDSKTKMK